MSKGREFAYIRVSTVDQNDNRQLADCDLDSFYRVYRDKVSGKDANRPELQECLSRLDEHDTLHVHSIDRLARNLIDLKAIVESLTKKGVTVHFHKENLVFSGEHDPMKELMLNMMASFAQFERELINERIREGVAVAKAKGIKFGRESKLSNDQIAQIRALVENGRDKKSVAQEFGISRPTLYKALNR